MSDIGNSSVPLLRCERCGRENSPALRFCQDCGNRLGAGQAAASLPSTQLTHGSEPQRPSAAPDFGRTESMAQIVCSDCHTQNPRSGRFCVNCGASFAPAHPSAPRAGTDLAAAAAPPLGASISSAQRPAPPPLPPPKPRAVLAAPVVSVAERPAPVEEPIHCSRCRGANARHMTFCQFCGTRLDASEGLPLASLAVPTPSARDGARFVVIAQDGTPGRQYSLDDEQIDIGREEGSILLPSDPYVSPRHARILRRGGRFFVRDLSSVNGVYVRIRAAERLQHADLVLIGLEVLRFEVVSDAEKGLGPATERGTRVFGSPALPRYARLCQRTVEGAARDVFYLGRDEAVIGRESGDLVFTNDPFMSRRHAVFSRDAATSTFSLQDLASSNGTYLAIRGEHEIVRGDHVRIGQHLFRLDTETGGAST